MNATVFFQKQDNFKTVSAADPFNIDFDGETWEHIRANKR